MEWKHTLTDAQKARLTEIARWQHYAFPNGSSYQSQMLPDGDYGDVSIKTVYNCGYYCAFADEPGVTRVVDVHRRSVGPGADFGISYCTRDQALVALV